MKLSVSNVFQVVVAIAVQAVLFGGFWRVWIISVYLFPSLEVFYYLEVIYALALVAVFLLVINKKAKSYLYKPFYLTFVVLGVLVVILNFLIYTEMFASLLVHIPLVYKLYRYSVGAI